MASIRIQATPRGMTLRLNGRDVTSLIEPGSTSIEWRDGVPVVTFRVLAPELLADWVGCKTDCNKMRKALGLPERRNA